MLTFTDKSQCCGCTACASICPKQAITMQPDGLGFLYPIINKNKCIECGLCEDVCTFNSHYEKSDFSVPEVYAVRHKNISEIETSRSGAVFIALSDWILEKGGIVYGVGYTDHFRAIHKRATTKQQRDEFKGSKYVQSDLNTVFIQIKNDLKQGLYVLFSGTPCQTSGLRSYLKKIKVDVDKLFIVDLVCHGVPAPYIWRDYLTYIERKKHKKVTSVDFRDKSKCGWAAHKESFTFSDKTVVCSTYSDLFCKGIMFRHSCGNCYFANLNRPSDVTIADFWGWEKVDTEFNADDKGVSLLLINSAKGKFWFDQIKAQVYFLSTDVEHCLQPNLQYPSVIHSLRNQFEEDYIKKGFIYVGKKYGNLGFHLFQLLHKIIR
ncbi:Coenzyme F420 hydrogenase/dehydrogenase, beta subunit C-terminal domain [Phocaeicola coprophilus]|uniref:Coenzyme F420 hydrogenase/dehydrogenase, beta subunit C-terminal domain n=1 Tax=Phocaeicola coprophilus TaxID=387090 RepID=UPI00255C5C5E|nr:Coenzyme F420 hydrogenase/dehydrogenase, beta subunit C-terminal domain [Phocaeicola coprophilus]